MSLEMLKTRKRVIGIKQVSKAVEKGNVEMVYIAKDADVRLITPLKELCSKKNVTVEEVPTMIGLGRDCVIDVGTAAAAVLKGYCG